MSGDFDTVLSVPGGEILELLEEFGHIDLDFHHDLAVSGEGTNKHHEDATQNNGVIEFNILSYKGRHVTKEQSINIRLYMRSA